MRKWEVGMRKAERKKLRIDGGRKWGRKKMGID
jgi:hypothetical protein